MSQFLHHDGLIMITDGVDTLTISLAEWLTMEPAYTLSAPYVTRRYIPGVSHLLYDANNNQFPGVMPYTDGDTYIANLSTYITSHETPTTLEEAKTLRKTEVDQVALEKKLGHVLLFSTGMLSHGVNSQQLISYNELGNVPVGFYIRDINNANVTLTLAQLNQLNNGIVQLHNLCDVNADALKDAIDALLTIPDVMAFNVDTGWPTVPYTPV